jgi:hypothetical protein
MEGAMFTRKFIGAALMSTVAALPALAQDFCQAAGDKISLDFEVKPSLVAHSDAIMDTTFGAAGEAGGAPNERLFSFARTIGAILESASSFGGTNTPVAREAFVQTMLDSFALADGFALNPDAGVLMPLDARGGERLGLSAANLLDETNPQGMKPLAVFNRFDLAPADWIHCGEHRIVYGKESPNFPLNRFLLIFEAAVPNPDPAAGEAGCRPITEFWAGLSAHAGDDTELARRLAAFFYEGKTDPSLATPDLPGAVVDYRNYGGDGSRGQVRGNLFVQQPWQLREWLTQPTFNPANPLAFVVETVKDNPLAELYGDSLNGLPIATVNVPAALTVLHGNFVAALTSDIRDHLMAEETLKHQTLANDLARFDLGTGPTSEVDERKILLNTVALGNDGRFNEHQSTSQGSSDEPLGLAGPILRTLLDQVGAATSPSPAVNPQTANVLLARAQAATCAGCHMTAPTEVIRQTPNQTDVVWPDVAAGGFVHVREADRMLSPALENHFLPVRRYILGRHLCPAAPPAEPTVALLAPEAGPVVGVPVDRSGAMRFVDAMVADFVATRAPSGVAGAPAAPADEQPVLAAAAIGQLDPVARDALRQKVHQEIAEARRIEQNVSGAFVEVRRPH